MSTPGATPVTGRKTVSWKIIVGVISVIVVAATVLVWTLVKRFQRHHNPSQPVSQVAAGGIEPTMQALMTGKSPEDIQKERSQAAWRASLQLSEEAQATRERTAKQANSFERRGPERKAKEVSMGGDALLNDVADAKVNLLLGTSRGPEQGGGKAGGEMFSQSASVPAANYMTLHRRRMIAAQQERQANGGNTSGDPKVVEGGPGPKMVPYDIPEETQPATPIKEEQPAKSSAKMPVNVLPPWTIPIPCTFDVNFVASGDGADTRQRIICNVEQDVVARNRVQLPRNSKIIGTSGGVRDLDLVDVNFDTIQFPDLTQVKIKGQAYQPFTNEAPGNYGMRGVMGEYEEPDVPHQLAPIFLAALQGAAKSNLERMQAGAIRVNPEGSGVATVAVQTTDKDRLYGAASSSLDKVVEMMLEKLKRYRPRVRVRAGSPVLIVLDEYVDLSKRDFMGHTDPLKQAPDPKPEAEPVPPSHTGAQPAETGASNNPSIPVDREHVLNALKNATPDQMKALMEMAGKMGAGETATNSK